MVVSLNQNVERHAERTGKGLEGVGRATSKMFVPSVDP
jgi:hypothetical protein